MCRIKTQSGEVHDRPAVAHITGPDTTHMLELQGPLRVSFIAFCQRLLFHVRRFILLFYLSWNGHWKSLPALSFHRYWGDVWVCMHIHKHTKKRCSVSTTVIEQTIQIAMQKPQNTYCPHYACDWPMYDTKRAVHNPWIAHERCFTF